MGGRNRAYVHDHPIPNTLTGSGRTTRSFFLPTFCRLSLNDVAKPTKFLHLSSSISSSPDPSSPKISCIGQIKKRSNTTTANYHHLTATGTSIAKSSTNLKNYTKLRKLFSAKNLISSSIDTTATITKIPQTNKCIWNRNRSCNMRPIIGSRKDQKHMISISDPVVAAVEELDPPLPVVKFRPRDQQMKVNLGKRRGIELKTLQIQPFQLSTIQSAKMIDKRDFTLLQPPPSSMNSSSLDLSMR